MDSDAPPPSASLAARPAGVIESVENALAILGTFEASEEIRVNQTSRDLGLSKSTVHRLLNTLALHGFVEQDSRTRSYRVGPALTRLGRAVLHESDFRALSRGAMEKLAQDTGETVHVCVFNGDHVLCLDSVESHHPVHTGSRAGWSLLTHATAAGKALLAEMTDAEVLAIYPDELIVGSGPVATVRRVDLLAELEFTRARGYATNFGQSEPDVTAIGVALCDSAGAARGSISVTAPRFRGDENWVRTTGPRAAAIAQEFRELLR